MLLVIEIVFSVPVISRIESIGVGRRKGAGGMGNRRWVKAPIWTQTAVLWAQYVTQAGAIHKEGQDCC